MRQAAALRVGMVMEQVLGHVSHYLTLRRVFEHEPGIDPRWVEVTYVGDGWLERATALPRAVRGTLRGYLQVRAGLRGPAPDAQRQGHAPGHPGRLAGQRHRRPVGAREPAGGRGHPGTRCDASLNGCG